MSVDFGLVIPMANEEKDFEPFIVSLTAVLNELQSGKVYLVVDNVSKDRTLDICKSLSGKDKRFVTVWAPENKNVVEAYIRGYKEALGNGHEYIIEMDAGLSHNPQTIPLFLQALASGYQSAFGSRFISGGSIKDSTWKRKFLSKGGTVLSNALLGSKMSDMTSGFQGFHHSIVEKFTSYKLLSEAHFYQTELRYLLRKTRYTEIPIQYKAPSPSVSQRSILNSFSVLLHYFFLRLKFKAPAII
jgi:dolichol-phosphate mannosyltransferase